MFLPLLYLQAAAPQIARQPQTIDVVSYQRVQHALPDGSPDLSAPDNFYVRVTSHYVLTTDSNGYAPDATGTKTISVPERSYIEYRSYEEHGKATPKIRDAFREVMPPGEKSAWGRKENGKGTFGACEQKVSSCYRYIVFNRKTEVETVETHSEGKRRLTRTERREHWGVHATMVAANDIFDPSKERVYWSESKPEVRVTPPTYTYLP